MVCGRVRNLLSAYLDLELTGAEMLAVREHLGKCSPCRTERDDLAQIRQLLGGLSAAEPRTGSCERALRALDNPVRRTPVLNRAFRWLGITPAARPVAGPWNRPHLMARRGVALAGAACAVLFGSLTFGGFQHPQHPDAVVAMIRPEAAFEALPPGYGPHVMPELWPESRLVGRQARPDDWHRSDLVRPEPAFELVGWQRAR